MPFYLHVYFGLSKVGSFFTLTFPHRCNNTNATFVIELTTDPDVLAYSLLPALPYSDPIAILYNLLGVDSYVFPETVSHLFFTPPTPTTLTRHPLTSTHTHHPPHFAFTTVTDKSSCGCYLHGYRWISHFPHERPASMWAICLLQYTWRSSPVVRQHESCHSRSESHSSKLRSSYVHVC